MLFICPLSFTYSVTDIPIRTEKAYFSIWDWRQKESNFDGVMIDIFKAEKSARPRIPVYLIGKKVGQKI